MIPLRDNLFYLEATSSPLSAESFVFLYPDQTIIFDVGNSASFLKEFSALKKPLIAVISHFHADHLGNAFKMDIDELYGSKTTLKRFKDGHLVEEAILIHPDIEIGLIPSSHEKGCCYLKFKDLLLVGDALYPGNHGYFRSRLMETVLCLKKLEFNYLINSHEAPKMVSKKEAIQRLMDIYQGNSTN